MTRFGDSSSDAARAVTLVEQAIRGLGIDPAASRTERDGHVAFALRRGSARILIAIHAPGPELPEGRLRVVAPVVRVPLPIARPRSSAACSRRTPPSWPAPPSR
ncbi:MAG: YbjN domain-containing protein [Sandaracinaceae bacterium]|nr:YbjN domain-containing protein [Sandaracinaceae bacterium]